MESRTTAGERIFTLAGVVVPFVGLIFAMIYAWGYSFGWLELSLLIGMYLITGFGVTVGYHRLFTHRAFEAPRPIKFLLAVMGSMAVEGPIIRWVSVHRRHHHHSDMEQDPHSPHAYGGGMIGVIRGWWHAHVGWIFKHDQPGLERYVRDLAADKMLCMVSRWFSVWVLIGLLIPTVIGGLIAGTWFGAFLGFLWGGLVRIFLVHHATWSVNSVCHLWGQRPFDCRDESRNNAIFGMLALGEGWHNNHHAFPNSARHGLFWYQFDFSYLVIVAMSKLGLARDVKRPSTAAIAAKRADTKSTQKTPERAENGLTLPVPTFPTT